MTNSPGCISPICRLPISRIAKISRKYKIAVLTIVAAIKSSFLVSLSCPKISDLCRFNGVLGAIVVDYIGEKWYIIVAKLRKGAVHFARLKGKQGENPSRTRRRVKRGKHNYVTESCFGKAVRPFEL